MENGEHRPVAVVTDEHVADQWGNMTQENDWIPFELDDLSLTSLAADIKTTFRPQPAKPRDEQLRAKDEEIAALKKKVLKYEEDMQWALDLMKSRGKGKKRSNSLLDPKEQL